MFPNVSSETSVSPAVLVQIFTTCPEHQILLQEEAGGELARYGIELTAQAVSEGEYKTAWAVKVCKVSCFCICSAVNRGLVK